MRVLVVGHSYVVGTNQAKLAAIAANGDVHIGLLVPNGWYVKDWRKRLPLERQYDNIDIFPARVPFEGHSGAYIFPPAPLARALLTFRPDVVHVEQEAFALASFQMALAAGAIRAPLTLFCWENVDRRLYWRSITREIVLKTAKLVIAGGQSTLKLLRKWGYKGRACVAPQFGVDTKLFYPSPRPACRAFTIGFIGRLVYEKGIDVLLTGASLLAARGYEFRIVICGSGGYKPKLLELAQRLSLNSRIHWVGAVHPASVPEVMRSLDVLVLPSRSVKRWQEQFGRVLIEAMATGLPVVGSDCGEIPNVIGREDLIFPEEDYEALSLVLERIIADPLWRQNVSRFVLARVNERYTNERVAQAYVDLWRAAAKGQGTPSKAPIATGRGDTRP